MPSGTTVMAPEPGLARYSVPARDYKTGFGGSPACCHQPAVNTSLIYISCGKQSRKSLGNLWAISLPRATGLDDDRQPPDCFSPCRLRACGDCLDRYSGGELRGARPGTALGITGPRGETRARTGRRGGSRRPHRVAAALASLAVPVGYTSPLILFSRTTAPQMRI